MEVAGNVTVQITGDVAPFEAALAKAKQMAATFDAQISAQLNGAGLSEGLAKIAALIEQTNAQLANLTVSSTSASATMSKVTASTVETTAALAEVAAATKMANAELSNLGAGGGTGLAAGTIAAKDFAAALEATGGRLDKITPQMLGLATGTEAVAAANQTAAESAAAVATGNEAVAATGRTAAASMTALGAAETEAAGLGAGVTREFMVLGSEVARGNFSRIPGSLIVMNERLAATGTGVLTLTNFTKMFGALAETVFNPYVLGFLAISIGTEVAVKSFEHLTSSGQQLKDLLKDQNDELTQLGKTYGEVAKQAEAFTASGGINGFNLNSTVTSKGLQIDVAAQTKVLMNQVSQFMTPGKSAGGFFGDVTGEFKPFADAIEHLRQTAAEGTPDILGFKRMVEDKWALDPNNAALTTTAAKLEALIKPALDAAVALQQLKLAQDGIKGRAGEGDAVVANMISAGNAAADALKAANENFGTSGLTSYENAVAGINQKFDDMIVKAHAVGAAFDTFNQARDLNIQEASLKALGNISFDKPIAGANALSASIASVGTAAAGVKVELGGMAAPIINITQLFGQAKLDQLIGIEQATQKLEGMKSALGDVQDQLDAISKIPANSLFGAGDQGTQADITSAYNQIDDIFKRYDSGNMSVKAVHDAIEQVRASLIALGGDVSGVNQFINSIINGELRVRQLNSDVQQLGQNIAHLPDKTITITVKTQQIGSGTMSMYDVPNSSGGTSSVGVTRYGAAPGQQSGPSITANQVPSYSGGGEASGSGSSYGLSGGTSTVNVWRFATGGMIHPGDTQSVSFFKSPDETVGIFTPGQMQALADPQSGFTGTQATANDNRAWTVLMNIEANTQKTAQLLDDIKTATASSGSSAFSSTSTGGSSSVDTSQQDQLAAQYAQVLKQVKSNFVAAGIVGGGLIGYGSDGLGSTPQEIARNIVYGGMKPVAGFATGGMIAPGDSQEVRFFKSPEETVAIFTPAQVQALQGANQNQQTTAAADQRPINIYQTHNWNGNSPPSKDSVAELRRQTALAVRDAVRSINGR